MVGQVRVTRLREEFVSLTRKQLVRGFVATLVMAASLLNGATAATAGPRIIGGLPASTPWTVSFQTVDANGTPTHRCGGAQIAPEWVVTAQHCLAAVQPGIQARFGSLAWKTGGVTATVTDVYGHPGYNGEFKDDIALVRVDPPVDPAVSGGIMYRLGKASKPNSGETALVSGWGTVCDIDITIVECRRAIPDWLQQLELRQVGPQKCRLVNPETGENLFYAKRMNCFVSADGQHRQACFGDSGSPISEQQWIEGQEEDVLVGIVNGDGDSWDLHERLCSTDPQGNPGRMVTTDVAYYADWIFNTIRDAGDASSASLMRSQAQFDLAA